MKNIPINTEKYSKIISEIEKFIEIKKKLPTIFKGTVEKIDISNSTLTIKLSSMQHNFSRGSIILIREDNSLSIDTRAIIKGVYNSNIELEIKKNAQYFENKKVIIDTEKTNVILERLKNIVDNIKKEKISLDNIRILDFIVGDNKPKYSQKKVSFTSKILNENQKEAVKKSIEAHDFNLIIGPPGTGKTYVIEELIRQFSIRNKKILITAWTNLAVDNIIKRLSKKETRNLVRIGPIDKIDSEVKKFSIDEKIKEHKDWKEVETYHRVIEEMYKLAKKIKDEMNFVQRNINKTKDTKEILNKEIEDLIAEEQKFNKLLHDISTSFIYSINDVNKNSADTSSINNELNLIDEKSEACMSLSTNILQMNNLQSIIPERDKIEDLKRLTRNIKISIIGKKVSSIFYKNKEELKRLEKEYEKNRKYLEGIYEIRKKLHFLIKLNEIELNKNYPKGAGYPDKDAVNYEAHAYRILEDKYIHAFKEQENSKIKLRTSEINKEVYKIYSDSLKIKIDLIDTKIKGLNTELYIQINNKDDLCRQYENLSYSLDLYKKNIDKLIKAIVSDIIDKSCIIAATAISSCHSFLDDKTFDVMIMDESTQVASFMSLLPLIKCKKFILVGDPRQLQPIEEDISKEMNLSIFNRLLEMYPDASSFLPIQYRMHKTIAKIANEIFYEGILRNSENVAERILNLKVSRNKILNPKIPCVFVDTSKAEYYEDEVGYGCSNIKEAKYVSDVVSLFIKEKINPSDIGVVTPYVKQKIEISRCLQDIKINEVEVDTVHKFQGREKDIIIISFARSKSSLPQSKLNFIENENLVNVAITRAKKKLILVGNSKTLCQSKLLNTVIDKIGKKNSIIL